jgi:hypothetical protein
MRTTMTFTTKLPQTLISILVAQDPSHCFRNSPNAEQNSGTVYRNNKDDSSTHNRCRTTSFNLAAKNTGRIVTGHSTHLLKYCSQRKRRRRCAALASESWWQLLLLLLLPPQQLLLQAGRLCHEETLYGRTSVQRTPPDEGTGHP